MRQSKMSAYRLKSLIAATLVGGIVAGCSVGAQDVTAPAQVSARATADSASLSKIALARAVAAPTRTPANVARDRYRHPMETLSFFEVAPEHVVVEFYPGGGWYTEILAPLVKDRGRYVAVAPSSPRGREAVTKLLADRKAEFGNTAMVGFDPASDVIWEAGTADRVLTFRNAHNLIMAGDQVAANAFRGFYKALKPGGILGVVDHRLPESADPARERSSGYPKTSTVRRLAEQAGFRFVASSEINANPRDTADWPEGVWTLPPSLRLKDQDREKYVAIGESDRMTLKFVKPK